MVKNCRILINNDAVTVVDFDGVEVQLPSIQREARFVKVCATNGVYSVVDDSYIEPVMEVTEKPKKKANKKTTVNEGVDKNIQIDTIADENEDA